MGLRPRLRGIAASVQVPFKSRASCRKLSAYLFSKLQFLIHWQLLKKKKPTSLRSRFAMEMRGLEPLPLVGHVLCPPLDFSSLEKICRKIFLTNSKWRRQLDCLSATNLFLIQYFLFYYLLKEVNVYFLEAVLSFFL